MNNSSLMARKNSQSPVAAMILGVGIFSLTGDADRARTRLCAKVVRRFQNSVSAVLLLVNPHQWGKILAKNPRLCVIKIRSARQSDNQHDFA